MSTSVSLGPVKVAADLVDSLKPTSGQSQNNPAQDLKDGLKEGLLALVMPAMSAKERLDVIKDTVEVVGKFAKHLQEELERKAEEERLAEENRKRAEKKPTYLELLMAAEQAAREYSGSDRSNASLIEQKLTEEMKS